MTGAHFLHDVSLFASLSIEQLEPLAQRLVTRKYQSGEHIFSQGSPGNSLYIVKSGLVSVVATESDGSTQKLAEFGTGQVFGEFALLDGLPRSAGAIASERSELLILSRPEFFIFLEQHPQVAIQLLVLLSRRLRFSLQRGALAEHPASALTHLAHILTLMAERYGDAKDGHIELSIRLTLGEIAGLMGHSRSDAEQALEDLQKKNLISLHGLHMTIHNLDELRRVASEHT